MTDHPPLCASCEHLAQMHNGIPPTHPCEESGCTCKQYIAMGPDLPDNHPEAEPSDPPINKDDYPMVTLEQFRGFVHTSLNADYELAIFEQQNSRLLEIAKMAKTQKEEAHRLFIEEFGEPNIFKLLFIMVKLEDLAGTARTCQILMQNARTAFEVHNQPEDFPCESPDHGPYVLRPQAATMIGTTMLCREHAHEHGMWAPGETESDSPDIHGDLVDRLMGNDPNKVN